MLNANRGKTGGERETGTRPFREKIPKSGSILTDCQACEVAGYVRDVNSFDSNNNNPRSRISCWPCLQTIRANWISVNVVER